LVGGRTVRGKGGRRKRKKGGRGCDGGDYYFPPFGIVFTVSVWGVRRVGKEKGKGEGKKDHSPCLVRVLLLRKRKEKGGKKAPAYFVCQ